MTTERVQQGTVRDIAGLGGPPLQLIVQHACRKGPAQHLYSYLAASKNVRSAVLEHCAGTAEATYTWAQSLEQVEVFAAWLATYGHLLGSLEFSTYAMKSRRRLDFEKVRDAAEKAVASAVACSPCRGLHLRTCKLSHAGDGIADLLMELPGDSLTNLILNILQPESNTMGSTLVLVGLSDSLRHLTSLRELSLDFSTEGCGESTVLDPMLQQLSALTNLTSLWLSDVLLTHPLRHLPPSLKFLFLRIDYEADGLDLRQLTALTRLEINEYTCLAGNYILPPNLLELNVGDIDDVACVLPLKQLQVLSLQHCDMMHPVSENLRQLSSLKSLKSIDLDYHGHSTSVINNAADAWQLLPIQLVSISPIVGNLSHNTIAQLGKITELRVLTLWLNDECKCNCTPNDFASTLCKLTNLELLHLHCCVRWEDPETASKTSLDPLLMAISHLKWLKDLTIDDMPISHKTAKHLAESVACKLTSLALWNNGVEDCDVIAMLLASPKLEQLS